LAPQLLGEVALLREVLREMTVLVQAVQDRLRPRLARVERIRNQRSKHKPYGLHAPAIEWIG